MVEKILDWLKKGSVKWLMEKCQLENLILESLLK